MWEGGAAFMILELGSILPDYVRTFPGTVYIHDRELLTDHHLDLNTLHLFVYQGSFKKGAGELDLSNGPGARMGLCPRTA